MNILFRVKKIFNYEILFKILLVSFQMLGLLPISLDKEVQQWKFLCSKKLSIFILSIIIILSLFWNVTDSYFAFKILYKKLPLFEKVMIVILRISTCASALIILIKFSYRRGKIAEIANEFSQMRIFLIRLNKKTDVFMKKALFRSTLLFTIFLILNFLQIYGRYLYSPKVYFYYRLSYDVNSFILNATLIQYSNLMLLITELFRIINDSLLQVKKKYLEKIVDIQLITLSDSISAVNELQDLHKLNLKLHQISRKLSKFFSMPIFLCISLIFYLLGQYSYTVISSVLTIKNWKLGFWFMFFEVIILFHFCIINLNASLVINEVSSSIIISRQEISITVE